MFTKKRFALAAPFITFLAIIAVFISTPAYGKEVNAKLSSEQISRKFNELYEKYGPGDLTTGKDADFIRRYATDPATPQAKAEDKTKAFNQTASGYGTTVRFKGKLWHKGTFEYNFGGNMSATVTSGPTPKR